MKQELILLRNVEVETWRVQGSVAHAKTRKDIMIVLAFLKESEKGTAKELAQHLLFDNKGRLVVAERLLEITRIYSLTESEKGRYALSERGFNALEKKKVFIPKYGCWKLSVSNDPLLPHKIINVKEFPESNAMSEIIGKGAKSKLESRKQNMKPIPKRIKDCTEIETMPHAGGEAIRIDSIENKAETVEAAFSLTLEWHVSSGSVRLLEMDKILTQFEGPKLSQDDVWKILLANEDLLDDWDDEKDNLAREFAEVDDAAKKLMVTDLKFASPAISDYGDFNDLEVKGVALRAASESDAKQWADWRLNQSIDSIATTKKYEGWVREALSPFGEFNITLPERAVYAQALWDDAKNTANNTKAWHMIAAADWAL